MFEEVTAVLVEEGITVLFEDVITVLIEEITTVLFEDVITVYVCVVGGRTGKRTVWGLLKDGVNATYRYYINNFYDGFRQVALPPLAAVHSVSAIVFHCCRHEVAQAVTQ